MLLFSFAENFQVYKERFLQSDLGKIYLAIPWEGLIKEFGLKENKKGTRNIFSPQGKIALMFLKHYAGVSDKRLIEQLNSNIDYQIFCDMYLGLRRLKNYKIVSQIRGELSSKLNIEKIQKVFYAYWSTNMNSPSHLLVDATCYESEVRYPTDVKLLWESTTWLTKQTKHICKSLKIRQPRTKYIKWAKRYTSYSKMRRKTKKKRIPLTRALLKLTHKYLGFLKEVHKEHNFMMPDRYYKTLNTIKKVYTQQYLLFTKEEKPKGRIISLSKSYLRPIVRGKETKPVEFGAKVNKFQIDGINFIEHISFNAFNEGTRLKSTVYTSQSLTHTKVKIIGADAIYATNSNRTFVTKNGIKTDFRPKGKPPKDVENQRKLKRIITKERATRLEGSFGKEKEHYHLKKIKAKTKLNEILWIFFGIHTANCLEIGRRIFKAHQAKVA